MFTFLVIIIILVCVLLALAVLIQNPKGSGLGAGFANIGNQVMGARRATETIEKATWTLAITLLALTLLSAMFLPDSTDAVIDGTNQSQVEGLRQERGVTVPNGFTAPETGGSEMAPAPAGEPAPETTPPAQ